MTSRRTRQRGAVIIEATLTLLLYLGIVLALFDFGMVLFIQQTLTHRARDAARYAVIHAYENSGTLTPKVRNLALCGNTTSCSGLFGLTPGDVSVELKYAAASPTTSDAVVITIPSKTYSPLSPSRGPLARPPIRVSMPVENTVSIDGL